MTCRRTTDEAMSADDILKAHSEGGIKVDTPKQPSAPTMPFKPTVPNAKPYDDSPTEPKITVDTEWMARNYRILNDKYFGGRLPSDVKFYTNNSRTKWGEANRSYIRNTATGKLVNKLTRLKITLSNFNKTSEHTKLGVLLHEMVHIADYHFHPEHFIKEDGSGKKTKREYDVHGPIFFLKEAARLKQYGWNITRYVTSEELSDAEISDENRARADSMLKNALAGVLIYPGYSFMFKTDRSSLSDIEAYFNKMGDWYQRNGLEKIEFYEVGNMDFALSRSCKSRIFGWKCDTPDKLAEKMKFVKAGKLFRTMLFPKMR